MLKQVEPIRKLGGRLRSLWDGLRVSKIEERIRSKVSDEVSALSGSLDDERKARRKAERSAVKATKRAAEIALEHEMTGRELTRAKKLIPVENSETPIKERDATDVKWGYGGRHGV